MESLFENLRNAVNDLRTSYDVALTDLTEEVTKIADAVFNLTGGSGSAKLAKKSESEDSVLYSLQVLATLSKAYGNMRTAFDIVYFKLNSFGYPIHVSSTSPESKSMIIFDTILNNKEDILAFFEGLTSNPSSALVLRVAYVMRKLKEDNEGGSEPKA